MNAHDASSTGGACFINGLPKTAAGRHFAISVGYYNNLIQNQTQFTGTVQHSSQQILLRHSTGAGTALAALDYSNAIGTSTEMIVSGCYSTD